MRIGTVIGICAVSLTLTGMTAGSVIWVQSSFETKTDADNEYETLRAEKIAGDVDSQLMAIEAELTHLREVEGRRPLTLDEVDRRDYLRQLREMLQRQRLPA